MINELIFKQIGTVDYHFICDKVSGLILSKVKNNVIEKSEVIYPFAHQLIDGCTYHNQLYIICQNREGYYMLIKYENPAWHKFDLFSNEVGSAAILGSHMPYLIYPVKGHKDYVLTMENLSDEAAKQLPLAHTQSPFLFDCASTNELLALCHINLQGELFASYYHPKTMETLITTPLFKGQHITNISCNLNNDKLYTLLKSGSHHYLIISSTQKRSELKLYDMGTLITTPLLFFSSGQMRLIYLREGIPHIRTLSSTISKGTALCDDVCIQMAYNKTIHHAVSMITPIAIAKGNKIISLVLPV